METETFQSIRDKGLLIYEYIRGSHSYGLATEQSDIDTGGVFLAPAEQLLGLGFDYQDQVESDKCDDVWFELNKFMRLLLKSNPTVLESLFIPDDCIKYEHPIMTKIKKHRDKFVTKKCFDSFGGYAVTQIKKARGLNKKIVNPVKERLEPLDFVYTFYKQGSSNIKKWLENRGLEQKYCGLVNIPNMHDIYGCYYDWGQHFKDYGITERDLLDAYRNGETDERLHKIANFIIGRDGAKDDEAIAYFMYNNMNPKGYSGIVGEDHMSNELRLSSVSKGEKPICWVSYNQTGYTKHCIDYKNYKDWEKNRNPVRYESNLNKNYDSKNISHSFRLIAMCTEIARGEGFKCDRRGIDREFLLDVKNHKYEYDEVIEMLEARKREMDEAIANSTIPDDIDVDLVNGLLLDIRKQQLKL